jgi:PAS domain S-box-containing protein
MNAAAAGDGRQVSRSLTAPLSRRVLLLILILICVAMAASLSAISLLYRSALNQQKARLLERAEREAEVIREIVEHEEQYAPLLHENSSHGMALEAAIGMLRAAHERVGGFGRTGEYLVGRQVGDSVVFLVGARLHVGAVGWALPFDTNVAVPMQRAVRDSSGVAVLRDYRGAMVVAGYATAGSHDLGVVVKIDLAEVRAPYVRAGLFSGGIAVLAALLGTLLFVYITRPLLRRVTESEERFRQFFERAPTYCYMVSPDGTILDANLAARAILGYTREELVGIPLSAIYAPDSQARLKELLSRWQGTGQLEDEEMEIQSRTGERRTVLLSAGMVRDASGQPLHSISLQRDITDRKQAEMEQARLSNALKLKADELEQLIHAATHDLRSPLVSVQGFVGELKAALDELSGMLARVELSTEVRVRASQLLGDDIPTSLRYVLAGSEKLGALLTGLLRLSRLGRAALKIETVDMNRIAASVAAAQAYSLQQAGAKIEIADLPPCRADAEQVSQVLSNLLDNAIKYRDPARPLVVSVTGRRKGASAEYCVEDNGIGIAPELRQRVFGLFYRADPQRSEGEGLGLTIVRWALGRLGGEIELESKPGKGSRFCFKLPAGGREET